MSLAHRLHHYFAPRPSNNHRARFLHPSPIVYFAGIFALIQIAINRPQLGPLVLGYASNISPEAVINLTNGKRKEAGIGEVSPDSSLTIAAQNKAQDMFAKNYWAHVSPTGTEPWFFISQAKYNYLLAGENLARDFNDSKAVVEAWVNSQYHRENLLNPRYKDIGVAVANGTLGGVETTLVVQMFGTRLTGVPEVGNARSIVNIAEAKTPPASFLTLGKNRSSTLSVALREPKLVVNPFVLTRGLASFILIFLLALLIVDIFVIWRRKIYRLSSDSAAHMAFLLTIAIIVWLIKAGVIL